MSCHPVEPGARVRLDDFDAAATGPYGDDEDAAGADLEHLTDLRRRLYAERRRALPPGPGGTSCPQFSQPDLSGVRIPD